ncbi:MAG: hypothetical protein KatS3mg095_0784 [Candidatus Parcubacteria bacterium]|nr:MAG: hypothetical protein KatS3mg095_0784 [Candidatus Parcubacteria bacterium]
MKRIFVILIIFIFLLSGFSFAQEFEIKQLDFKKQKNIENKDFDIENINKKIQLCNLSSILISPESATLEVKAGEKLNHIITITNKSSCVFYFAISIDAVDKNDKEALSWVSQPKYIDYLSVPANTTTNLEFNITIPSGIKEAQKNIFIKIYPVHFINQAFEKDKYLISYLTLKIFEDKPIIDITTTTDVSKPKYFTPPTDNEKPQLLVGNLVKIIELNPEESSYPTIVQGKNYGLIFSKYDNNLKKHLYYVRVNNLIFGPYILASLLSIDNNDPPNFIFTFVNPNDESWYINFNNRIIGPYIKAKKEKYNENFYSYPIYYLRPSKDKNNFLILFQEPLENNEQNFYIGTKDLVIGPLSSKKRFIPFTSRAIEQINGIFYPIFIYGNYLYINEKRIGPLTDLYTILIKFSKDKYILRFINPNSGFSYVNINGEKTFGPFNIVDNISISKDGNNLGFSFYNQNFHYLNINGKNKGKYAKVFGPIFGEKNFKIAYLFTKNMNDYYLYIDGNIKKIITLDPSQMENIVDFQLSKDGQYYYILISNTNQNYSKIISNNPIYNGRIYTEYFPISQQANDAPAPHSKTYILISRSNNTIKKLDILSNGEIASLNDNDINKIKDKNIAFYHLNYFDINSDNPFINFWIIPDYNNEEESPEGYSYIYKWKEGLYGPMYSVGEYVFSDDYKQIGFVFEDKDSPLKYLFINNKIYGPFELTYLGVSFDKDGTPIIYSKQNNYLVIESLK